MSADLATNEVRQSSSLVSDVTDDVCRVEFIEIVPLSRDTDDQSTTECDSADWTAAVKQEILPVVKQEQPGDVPVYCVIYVLFLTVSHMQGVMLMLRLNYSINQ